eukprot:scaffold1504_cov417-Prasinococcus_capsulatus_cf.AAC.34
MSKSSSTKSRSSKPGSPFHFLPFITSSGGRPNSSSRFVQLCTGAPRPLSLPFRTGTCASPASLISLGA